MQTVAAHTGGSPSAAANSCRPVPVKDSATAAMAPTLPSVEVIAKSALQEFQLAVTLGAATAAAAAAQQLCTSSSFLKPLQE